MNTKEDFKLIQEAIEGKAVWKDYVAGLAVLGLLVALVFIA